ncbi:MAG: creatininase family protein [Chloroflexi bacterium]|nr:creatininase family protein [Chloroflexota bacterium]MCL5074984.1 creatininase family protein [Chloroflexota bacterium]
MWRCWLQEWKWPEVEAHLKENDLILLPVGSTEQHGQHMPLGTDAFTAIRLAEDAARETMTLVAPPFWYGWSVHHMGYPGTITLRPETVAQVVTEVCYSLISHGFGKVIIVNGHARANLPPLQIAATRVRNETGAYVAVVDPWDLGDTISRELRTPEPGSIGHGAQHEGSQMLYLYPNLVDMSKARRNVWPQGRFHISDPYLQGDRIFVPQTMEEFKQNTEPSGVYGDATVITAEKGERFHKALVANLVELIKQVRPLKVQLKTVNIPY